LSGQWRTTQDWKCRVYIEFRVNAAERSLDRQIEPLRPDDKSTCNISD
jgi:hypothetical protein